MAMLTVLRTTTSGCCRTHALQLDGGFGPRFYVNPAAPRTSPGARRQPIENELGGVQVNVVRRRGNSFTAISLATTRALAAEGNLTPGCRRSADHAERD